MFYINVSDNNGELMAINGFSGSSLLQAHLSKQNATTPDIQTKPTDSFSKPNTTMSAQTMPKPQITPKIQTTSQTENPKKPSKKVMIGIACGCAAVIAAISGFVLHRRSVSPENLGRQAGEAILGELDDLENLLF